MNGNGQTPLDRLSRLYRQLTGRGLTREDLFSVLDRAQRQGLFEQDTLDTIERVVQVSELRVRDIMIPRARMVVINKGQSPDPRSRDFACLRRSPGAGRIDHDCVKA